MRPQFTRIPIRRVVQWLWIALLFLPLTSYGQAQTEPLPPDPEIDLKGAIDIHSHPAPDSMARDLDADDLARLAKQMGMRGIVLKNHWAETASLAYMVRKEVPGIELFGGITQDLAIGGINLEAVKHMVAMKGHYGRVIWLPTFDSEANVKMSNGKGPFVRVSENGKLLPGVLELIDWIAQHPELVLETGHVTAEEGLMVIHEARMRGVKHIVVTHAMFPPIRMNIPQMQQAAADGAFIEFTYGATLGARPSVPMADYINAIRAVGPKYCILATDFGPESRPPTPPRPPEPQGMLDFMITLHKAGFSVADINLMAKTNPALALGLDP